MTQFVAYYRVSTDRQGRSGLGLDAQKKAVLDFLKGVPREPGFEFTEIETGKRNERPQLERALAACRKYKAKLVIAKLDRLSRNLAFVAQLMDAGVEFVAVDNPFANKLTVHILAAVAQHEREMIAERTKAALQAAKRRGVKLGRHGSETLAPAYKQAAIQRAINLAPLLSEFSVAGLSARQMARLLNERKVPTPGGRNWHAQTVLRALDRLAAKTGPSAASSAIAF